jgi:hypothetical protein
MNEDLTDTFARNEQNRLSIKLACKFQAATATGWNVRVHLARSLAADVILARPSLGGAGKAAHPRSPRGISHEVEQP